MGVPRQDQQAATSDAKVWLTRIERLQDAMRTAGRTDLADGVLQQARDLAALDIDDSVALELFPQALVEIRACVVSADRAPDPSFLAALRSALARARSRASAALAEAPTPQEPEDNPLEGFLEAGDDDLDALLEAIDEDIPVIPASRPTHDGLGTLSEPLVPAEDGAAPVVLMKGQLQPGLLSDVIQMFAQNSETGRLVLAGENIRGEIYFDLGAIVDAACGSAKGEEGFFEVMKITEGRFAYERGAQSSMQRIFRSAQHLLMEALRLQDEVE